MANRIPVPVVQKVAAPYVAGDKLAAAVVLSDRLWADRGILTTLDVLGERVGDASAAERALELYLRAAAEVAKRPWASLSIKPGHFGHYVSLTLCEAQIRELALRCQAQGTPLTIDMEDTDLTDRTLELYRGLKSEFSVLGLVLQTKLFRTADDLRSLTGLDGRVRFCIGVYDVPKTLGHGRRAAAKQALVELLPLAFETLGVVEIATHDEGLIRTARSWLESAEIPMERVEFQMLLGVPRTALQDELVAAGYPVRLYLPFSDRASDAVAYLRRRLAESPSLAVAVLKNMFSLSR